MTWLICPFQAKYLPGYKQVYKHLKPDAVPTIFADSKPTNRRLHTEQRIAKKERQELVAKLIEEYDKEKAEKEKAEKEKETKNSDNGSEKTKDTQTEVDNATDCNDNNTEHNGADTNNGPHDKPSVYIDTAEPYSMDINATKTGYTDVLSTSFNILPNFDADNYVASANMAFESVFSYMESEQAANNAPTADSNTNLNGEDNSGPCPNLESASCSAETYSSGGQFIPQTDNFMFNSDDSVGIDSTTTGSGNCKSSVRPGRIDRTSPDTLSLIPHVTVNSIVSNSEQSGSQRNKKRKKNPNPIYEYTEPKYKEIGIQVSVETCDKGVECDIPLDHTNSASCANCFARENPALAMSDHKYSFRTDSQGRRVSKSNYHPKKKGSALAAIIQRLSNIDQREPEATINELARTEIETEIATNDLCEASTENKDDQENPVLVMEVNEESSSVDNESSVDVKEAPLEGIESSIDVIESPSVDNESSVDVKEAPLVGIVSSIGVKEPPMGDSESSKDVIKRPFDNIESSIGVIESPSVDNESSVDVKEAPLECIESSIDVIERLVDIGSSLENPTFVVYENPPSVQEGLSTDVEEPSLRDSKQSVKNLTNLETDARSLDNSDEIGNNFVSGQTVGDLRIPIGGTKTPRNLSQTCSGSQENHSKIPVDNTKDPLYQVETVEYQTQNPAFTPDTVVCDAVIPMDDCVIQLNETMEDATSCDTKRQLLILLTKR